MKDEFAGNIRSSANYSQVCYVESLISHQRLSFTSVLKVFIYPGFCRNKAFMKSNLSLKRQDEKRADKEPNLYTLQGVIQYLQYEAFKNERDHNLWEIERAELKVLILYYCIS